MAGKTPGKKLNKGPFGRDRRADAGNSDPDLSPDSGRNSPRGRREEADCWEIDDHLDPQLLDDDIWDVFCDEEADRHRVDAADDWDLENFRDESLDGEDPQWGDS